jgi:hypothetical protein
VSERDQLLRRRLHFDRRLSRRSIRRDHKVTGNRTVAWPPISQ